jgi:hypothetical protein
MLQIAYNMNEYCFESLKFVWQLPEKKYQNSEYELHQEQEGPKIQEPEIAWHNICLTAVCDVRTLLKFACFSDNFNPVDNLWFCGTFKKKKVFRKFPTQTLKTPNFEYAIDNSRSLSIRLSSLALTIEEQPKKNMISPRKRFWFTLPKSHFTEFF